MILESTNNRFVITGGPGSGKTSLIEALQQHGYCVFPEIARSMINNGVTPPIRSSDTDYSAFFNLILQRRIQYHQQIKQGEKGFYDRGIPDGAAYAKYLNLSVPLVLSEAIAAYPYNPVVFFAPPWEKIYQTDQVRKESFTEAKAISIMVAEVYRSLGYRLVELPESPVNDRVCFVLRELKRI